MHGILAKFTPPSSLDIHPYRSVWQYKHTDGTRDYYIQMSEGPSMQWERLGFLMERSFENHILQDNCFIDDLFNLIAMYKEKEKKEEAVN